MEVLDASAICLNGCKLFLFFSITEDAGILGTYVYEGPK